MVAERFRAAPSAVEAIRWTFSILPATEALVPPLHACFNDLLATPTGRSSGILPKLLHRANDYFFTVSSAMGFTPPSCQAGCKEIPVIWNSRIIVAAVAYGSGSLRCAIW